MTLKQLIWRLVFPLTIISFWTITKWWFVLPIDGPDTMMIGFPFAFVSNGWHTSLSLQIFVFEFLLDLLTYFSFWLALTHFINRYLIEIKISLFLSVALWVLSSFMIAVTIWIASFHENGFGLMRDWDMKVLTTGFKLTWTHQERPDISIYPIKD